jgi:hypothetical protein
MNVFSGSQCLIILTQTALTQTNTDKSSSYTFTNVYFVCSPNY